MEQNGGEWRRVEESGEHVEDNLDKDKEIKNVSTIRDQIKNLQICKFDQIIEAKTWKLNFDG